MATAIANGNGNGNGNGVKSFMVYAGSIGEVEIQAKTPMDAGKKFKAQHGIASEKITEKADAKSILNESVKPEAETENKPEINTEKIARENLFIDYLPSKIIDNTMIIIEGMRIEHSADVMQACAVGHIFLQINGKRVKFGKLSEFSLTLDNGIFAIFTQAFSPSEDDENQSFDEENENAMELLASVKLEAEKKWCKGTLEELAKNKKATKANQRAKKRSRMKAFDSIL